MRCKKTHVRYFQVPKEIQAKQMSFQGFLGGLSPEQQSHLITSNDTQKQWLRIHGQPFR